MSDTNPSAEARPNTESSIVPFLREADGWVTFEFHDNRPTTAEIDEMARLDALKRRRRRMPHEL